MTPPPVGVRGTRAAAKSYTATIVHAAQPSAGPTGGGVIPSPVYQGGQKLRRVPGRLDQQENDFEGFACGEPRQVMG